mmetsp:Transcript_36987/g.101811  ORF Transcript_36987/g.101811 Transcript_36987/m.101811 type:complete len:218 (+) Transcript_36987:1666-2319(+)
MAASSPGVLREVLRHRSTLPLTKAFCQGRSSALRPALLAAHHGLVPPPVVAQAKSRAIPWRDRQQLTMSWAPSRALQPADRHELAVRHTPSRAQLQHDRRPVLSPSRALLPHDRRPAQWPPLSRPAQQRSPCRLMARHPAQQCRQPRSAARRLPDQLAGPAPSALPLPIPHALPLLSRLQVHPKRMKPSLPHASNPPVLQLLDCRPVQSHLRQVWSC